MRFRNKGGRLCSEKSGEGACPLKKTYKKSKSEGSIGSDTGGGPADAIAVGKCGNEVGYNPLRQRHENRQTFS